MSRRAAMETARDTETQQFWKQFFESSANVSLSGYEEPPSQYDTTEATVTEDSSAATHTTLETSQSYETPSAQHISTDSIQDLDLSNLTISPSHSTPRPSAKQRAPQTTFADYPSPYEALRQEISNTTTDVSVVSDANAPQTPGNPSTFYAGEIRTTTPQSSPFLPPHPISIPRPSTRKKTDPILHRVLDRNYRVQATPLTTNRYVNTQSRTAVTPATASRTRRDLFESTLSSSPDVAPPELHAEIFSSPQRKPRTPGVSVLTPARNKAQTSKLAAPPPAIWDSDDDLDDDVPFDQSPPKTMHFHVPQSRLLKTPGMCQPHHQAAETVWKPSADIRKPAVKQASKRIVEDLLATAGVGRDDDQEFTDEIETQAFGVDENSPSVVRRAVNIEDESF